MSNPVIRVPASPGLLEDVQSLKERLGATTVAETVRRAIARELLLLRALDEASIIEIPGRNEKGERIRVLM